MKVRYMSVIAALMLLFSSVTLTADTFDNQPLSNGWSVDRYLPDTVESFNFDGDNRLHIGLDPSDGPGNRPGAYAGAFYNTQGIQTSTIINGDWNVTAQAYVSEDDLTSSTPWRKDIWARTGTIGTETFADYAILSLGMFDLSNPLGGLNMSLVLQVWDSNVGWNVLDSSLITAGWNDLLIEGSAGGFKYGLNGVEIFTDAVVQMPTNLTTTFVEAYNFGHKTSHYWDNVEAKAGTASVPDTGATIGLLTLAVGAMATARRKLFNTASPATAKA